MASVFSSDERSEALARGWYTFRGIRDSQRAELVNETFCPANKGTHCAECMGCNPRRKRDRVIQEH